MKLVISQFFKHIQQHYFYERKFIWVGKKSNLKNYLLLSQRNVCNLIKKKKKNHHSNSNYTLATVSEKVGTVRWQYFPLLIFKLQLLGLVYCKKMKRRKKPIVFKGQGHVSRSNLPIKNKKLSFYLEIWPIS